jgi:hypothetical protein
MAAKSFEKLVLILVVGLAGCTGTVKSTQSLGQPQGASSTGTVATFLRTTQATGPAAFRIVVSGLSVTNSNGNPVPLLSSMEEPEIRHLDLAPTMFSQATAVPAGSYSSMLATLANPELSIVDAQGNVTQLTATTTPSVRLGISSISIPGTFSLTANGYARVMLDFDLDGSISRDATGNYVIYPALSAAQISDLQAERSLVDSIGTITNASSGTTQALTLKLQSSGSTVALNADGNTAWSSDIGQFSGLRTGETVEINAEIGSSGAYLAKFVGSSTANLSTTYEGLLTQVAQDSSGNYSINVVIQR